MNKSESKYFNTALLMDDALLFLLQKKEYEYITVKEICLKAGVNRSTFYLHYEKIDDLLKEVIEVINKKFYSLYEKDSLTIKEINKSDNDDLIFIKKKYLNPYLNYILENKKVFELMMKKQELFQTKRTLNLLYKNIFQPILNRFSVEKENQEYIFSYFFGGVLSIIFKWIEKEYKTDVDKISDLIINCVNRDLK